MDKKVFMGLFIAFIMIVSVLGFALSFRAPSAEKLEYQGYTFIRTNQGLRTNINDINIYFYYFPRDIADIEFDEGAKTALDTRVLWFTYDPNDEFATEIADSLFYIEDVLGTVSDKYVQRGLTDNTEYVLPEVSCANATTTVPVLLLQSGNETTIKHDNGCIIATAISQKEVYQIGDRILYQSLGVMQ